MLTDNPTGSLPVFVRFHIRVEMNPATVRASFYLQPARYRCRKLLI